MYILLKNQVVLGMTEQENYRRLQGNGYYISCNFPNATHIFYGENFYSVQEYRLFWVENVPDGLSFDETWVFEEGEILQSATLQKEKENMLFLASLSDLAMMELSARLDELEEKILKNP